MNNTFWIGAVAALAAVGASAQQISVHPDSPAPGESFFVRIEGTFPTPCSLNGNAFQTLQGGGSVVLTLLLEPDFCPAVIADLQRSFGAFELESAVISPGETVELIFRTDEGPTGTEIGRLELVAGEPGEKAGVAPQSGVYWDPFFANNGVAIESHGERLFVAAYTYDGDGRDTWRVAQGELNGNHFNGEFLAFADGVCLLCGDTDSAAHTAGDPVPVQVVFEGSQAAFLGTGDEPGRAMELRPFAQRLVESEGTIAGETFTMTDLGGRWLFTDTSDGELHLVTDLAQAPSGGADTGLAFFASPDRDVTMECGLSAGPERFACRLFVDGVNIGVAPSGDVSHNLIRGDAFIGIRLE